MTHEQILTEFTLNNYTKGDLVEITLNNGNVITGVLSYDKVLVDNPTTGENSRIGLLPPPPTFGKIINNQPKPIYSRDFIRIERVVE